MYTCMCTCICTCKAHAVEKRGENGLKQRQKSLQTDPNGGKNVCIAIKSRQQKAPAIKKLQNCKCDKWCRFAGRLPVQKPRVLPMIFQNSDGRLKRKSGEQKSFGAISAKKLAQWVLIWSLQCSKKWFFEDRLPRVGFQKCDSCSSGEHIFVKIRKHFKTRQQFCKEMCV